ncbi:MAG: DUF1549 domain-containing protein [Planctomycetota bacterium]|nr:MAG: DUF1549 domain-containing protein [Planctomycetota bacterium]
MPFSRISLAAGFFALALLPVAAAGELDPHSVAQRVDELLAEETYQATADTAELAPRTDDATFLRRVSLDLTGVPPTPEEITAFAFDTTSDKRARAVQRLLAQRQFGENWARYWRDVIMYRRSEDRALLAAPALYQFLTDSFNGQPRWDEIAHRFITATGDVREEGATALIMAQMGGAEDTTAEISRIFMGIQIQCAQCHDHPTDRWKREQFHELTAFFPRLSIRPVRVEGKRRSFAVVPVDRGRVKRPNNPRQGALEHFMPDLDHPEEEGQLMKPVFFVTGQQLDDGLPDSERRETIADWITDRKNRWFAKAYVNRMWSEMVGLGFYEPVDDIGPDRECSAPKTLDYLSDRFAASGYDVKWLFEVIAATDAYGRESRSRMDDDVAPFTAACPQRLRADQLFNALVEVLGISEGDDDDKKARNYRTAFNSPRGQVNKTFGYDPSVRRDEVAGSIPQALFLMNSPQLARAMSGDDRGTSLGRMLDEISDDEALVSELYLRCLAREPRESEMKTCLEHVSNSNERADAFEDILWALVNSTEFLNRN